VGRHGCRAALAAALCLLFAAPSAFAAEELGDAGDMPLTAEEAGPAGPLTEISGAVTQSADGDMYKVCLTAGTDFSASTVGTTGFDTQLFLYNEQGMGVYANDDAVGSHRLQSTLPAGNRLGPKAAGVYYLAVTAFNWDPQSLLGPIFPSSSGLVGPIGRGGSLPLSSWAANDQRPGGSYTILLTGTRSCIDATPPTAALRTPLDGAEYEQNEQVVADYDCADEADGSGLASCEGDVADGAAVDTSALGEHTFTVTARDRRGNETVVAHTYTVVDNTAPTVNLRTPPEGAVYVQGEEAVADYDCADEAGGSGLASCTGGVGDGSALDTAVLGAHSFTVTAVDGAGNTTTVTHTYRVSDGAAPTIDLRTPANGATYALGAVVPADFDCADDSSVATCVGTVPDGAPIDTATPGDHTFTVNATDAAGNPATRSVTYRVEERFRFDFDGFYWPVLNRPRVNVVRAGSYVPIRFSLDGYHGRDVIAGGYPRSREVACGSTSDVDGGKRARAAGRWKLRYKPRRDLYVFLWKTDRDWAGECRQFILKLDDGSYHRADFKFPGKHRWWRDRWDD